MRAIVFLALVWCLGVYGLIERRRETPAVRPTREPTARMVLAPGGLGAAEAPL